MRENATTMSMTTAAMAVAGRAARPCDVCGRKRARWYCAADEAYLCESCDSSVHEANALAQRHERVRLAPNGAPVKMDRRGSGDGSSGAGGCRKKLKRNSDSAVPVALLGSSLPLEVKVEEPSDHFTAEELTGNANLLDSPSASFDDPCTSGKSMVDTDFGHDFLVSDPTDGNEALNSDAGMDDGNANDWMGSGEMVSGGDAASELDLCGDQDLSEEEYCLDLEALRADQDGFVRSEIPSALSKGKPFKSMAANSEWVKSECGLPINCKIEGWNDCDLRQVPSLRLDYADVLSSWSDRGTLWTDDHSPQRVPDDSNSDIVGSFDLGLVPDMSPSGQMPMFGGKDESVNAGNAREARVIRYREKRRTRLFSKKIRYEVRKLNAERRPRMKGRFVKRSPGRE